MRNKKAKLLRRTAEALTIGQSVKTTDAKYKAFELIYKSFRKRGMIITEKDLTL